MDDVDMNDKYVIFYDVNYTCRSLQPVITNFTIKSEQSDILKIAVN